MKKLLVVAVLIIGVAVFGLQDVFAQSETQNGNKPAAKPAAKATVVLTKQSKDMNAVADVNKPADVNQAVAEPNEAEKEMAELEKKFERLDKTAGQETQEWMRRSSENRVKMLEATQKQTIAELTLVKNLALEEGATKTVKAVDILIQRRSERCEQMIASAKERQEKDAAREEREGKTSRERKDRRRK